MAGQHLSHTHPSGRTTGSPQRAGIDHTGAAMAFNLASELTRLHEEDTWQRSGRNSRTLFKEGDLRLVLITMKAGHHVADHIVAGRLAFQVISGHLRVRAPNQIVDLP